MVVLKKIKSATLVESLVATVIIVVIFMVSSLIINNLLLNQFNNNTSEIQNRIAELEYELMFKKIRVPYDEDFQNWHVSIKKESNAQNAINFIQITATKEKSKKEIIKKRIYEN